MRIKGPNHTEGIEYIFNKTTEELGIVACSLEYQLRQVDICEPEV